MRSDSVTRARRGPARPGGIRADALRRLAQRLAEREALLGAGEELTTSGSFERDLQSGEVRYSAGLWTILGLPADTPGPSRDVILERIHPEDRASLREALKQARRDPEPVTYQARLMRLDGVERVLRIRAKVVLDDKGQPAKLLGAAQDVTDELEAHHARDLLGYVVDSSDDAILTKTPQGVITSWNLGAERLYGYTAEEAIGQPLSLIVPAELAEEEEHIRKRVFSGDSIVHLETERVRKDGRRVSVSLTVSPVRDASGKIVSAAAIGRDITESKRAEEALRRSNEDLEQFASAVSHDLSEPLRVIAGFVDLLARRYQGRLDEDADRFIGFTIDGVERMQTLIDELLAYSRARGAAMKLADVDSASLVADVLATLQSQIAARGIRVEVGELPRVRAEPTLLREVFQNLIGNAVKFTAGELPRVRIAASHERDGWRFDVEDNGPGVDPQHAERVFAIFQRLHGREVPGSGMGLAIAKRLVERHGGTIWVQGAAGGGSSFRFTIPDHRVAEAAL